MATPTAIVAYLALFVSIAAIFLFVNLLVGRFLRPKLPNDEKLEVYECGEPTIGSSFVQFDLRFYVVALLFIIFDVEVAFFFPWATVFGKTVQVTSPDMPIAAVSTDDGSGSFSPQAATLLGELGVRDPETQATTKPGDAEALKQTARSLALTSLADIGVFFAVLLVGFAYVWRRGDLDWVRAVAAERGSVVQRPPPGDLPVRERTAGSILSA